MTTINSSNTASLTTQREAIAQKMTKASKKVDVTNVSNLSNLANKMLNNALEVELNKAKASTYKP